MTADKVPPGDGLQTGSLGDPGLSKGQLGGERVALESSFADRVAVLMRSRPVADAITAATRQAWPDDAYDIATFALAVIDFVISRQGFEDEVTHEEALAFVARLASNAAPDRPPDEHRDVATYVLNVLVNRANHGARFTYQISDFTSEGHLRREVRFWLLRLREDPARGVTVLNASSDAINALVGGLEFDVQDEQVANEAMLERQLARGAFAAAEKAAALHRGLSLKFAEEIQSIIKDTQRDLRSVLDKWSSQVPGRLDEARSHISERITMEHRLLTKARESLESDDPAVRAAAARISHTLDECKHRHQNLHHKVIGAREVFFTEQDRQAFRPPSLGLYVDVAADVFEPFLRLPIRHAQAFCEQWLVHVGGPIPRRIPDLGRLVNDLLELRRRPAVEDAPLDEDELADADPPTVPVHVRAAAVAAAGRVGLPTRMSTLIAECINAEDLLPDPAERLLAADLCVLAALWCYAPDDVDEEDLTEMVQVSTELVSAMFGERAVSDTDGTPLTLDGWVGDDLVVAAYSDQFVTAAVPRPTPNLDDPMQRPAGAA